LDKYLTNICGRVFVDHCALCMVIMASIFLSGLGWVGSISYWVGLGWITENGPTSMSAWSTTLLTWRNVANLHDLKIQYGGRRLGFRKMSITSNWIELFAQNLVGRCITAMRRWHMTKTRNRMFIRVTSLNECREHRCDDVKAYKSSQLTNLYFKPMQNSPDRTIV